MQLEGPWVRDSERARFLMTLEVPPASQAHRVLFRPWLFMHEGLGRDVGPVRVEWGGRYMRAHILTTKLALPVHLQRTRPYAVRERCYLERSWDIKRCWGERERQRPSR